MSSDIALLPLSLWTQTHIANIYKTTTPSSLKEALDAFLAQDAKIIVNGIQISRAEFANQLQSQKFDEAGAIVTFTGTVEAPAKQGDNVTAGSVGVFYNAIIAEEIRVRDAPVSSKITASVNVIVEQDLEIPVPPTPPGTRGGGSDRRRAYVLNQVFTDAPVPFNI